MGKNNTHDFFFSLQSDGGDSSRGPKKWGFGDVSTILINYSQSTQMRLTFSKVPYSGVGQHAGCPATAAAVAALAPTTPNSLASNPALAKEKKKEGN